MWGHAQRTISSARIWTSDRTPPEEPGRHRRPRRPPGRVPGRHHAALCDLVADHHGMGLCPQVDVRRTPDGPDRLAALPGTVWLVEGAYEPPREVAHREKRRGDGAYRDLLEQAFRSFDEGVAVGSHDPARGPQTGTAVRARAGCSWASEAAQTDLAAEVPVYQYAPHGTEWLSYSYRRVMERTSNALLAARALVDGWARVARSGIARRRSPRRRRRTALESPRPLPGPPRACRPGRSRMVVPAEQGTPNTAPRSRVSCRPPATRPEMRASETVPSSYASRGSSAGNPSQVGNTANITSDRGSSR
jgi:hypothetical protein